MPTAPKQTEIIVYVPTEAVLHEAVAKCKGLTIKGVDDKEGYQAVHRARVDLKKCRTEIENSRKQHKAEILERGRKIDDEAKRLTSIIEPTERELEAEQKRIDGEKYLIQREAEEAQRRENAKVIDDRVRKLAAVGDHTSPSIVGQWTDAGFHAHLSEATNAHEEKQRAAKEEAERLERERAQMAEERRLLDIETARQREEAKRLADERAKIEAAQRIERDNQLVRDARQTVRTDEDDLFDGFVVAPNAAEVEFEEASSSPHIDVPPLSGISAAALDRTEATQAEIARARRLYADRSNDDIEVDDDAACSVGEDGVWIAAWVWLETLEPEQAEPFE